MRDDDQIRTGIALKNALRILALLLLTPVLMLAAYIGIACALLLFPANQDYLQDAPADITAWVISNGVHVDLVLPARSAQIDWTTVFPLRDLPSTPSTPPSTPRYIAIGWGDREFYLNTQEIADITASRAIGALLGGHRTLVHVTYLDDPSRMRARRPLPLTATQYRTLVDYVRRTAVLRADGSAEPIVGRHYGPADAFYEAHGRYSAFNTCNTWIGSGLRAAGVKVSRWTPLDFMVTWHLRQNGTD